MQFNICDVNRCGHARRCPGKLLMYITRPYCYDGSTQLPGVILFKIMLFVCAWVLTELLPHPVYAWKQMIPLSILGEKNFDSSIA